MAQKKIDTTGMKHFDIDPGKTPDVKMVDITKITFDDTYAREMVAADWAVAREIGENFSYDKFLAVLLSPLARGKFAGVDGQVRVAGAQLAGITHVPAVVIKMTAKQQAEAYIAINKTRSFTDHCSLYKASLAANLEWALRIKEVVEAAGCKLMTYNGSTASKKPGQIYAIQTTRKFIENGQADFLTAVLVGLNSTRYQEHSKYYGADTLKVLVRSAIVARIDSPELMSKFLDSVDLDKLALKVRKNLVPGQSFYFLFRENIETRMVAFARKNAKKRST